MTMVKMPEVEIKLRTDTPQVGVVPYRQVHAHSTGNPTSTVQNEVDNQINNRPQGFANDWVGNSRIVRTSPLNRGAYDVGGGWNAETFASVELIESHRTLKSFMLTIRSM
jgi:N-acetylmuramoyl-L-alanine amidase